MFYWLNTEGCRNIKHNIGGFFECSLDASVAAELLEAELYEFNSVRTNAKITVHLPLYHLSFSQRSFSHTIPASVSPYIDFICRTSALNKINIL